MENLKIKKGRYLVHQIYYDAESFDQLDSGFLALDNSVNERPDWFEYWPIRNYLKDRILLDDVYYGFLSPKFYQKTGLSSSQIFQVLENSNADIISFSPYFDQGAYALNVFEQAEAQHPGISDCFEILFRELGFGDLIYPSVMTSEQSIFCNFFIAKKNVWNLWFDVCEKIFNIAESKGGVFTKLLNSEAKYSHAGVAAKVFVIERVISLLIFLNPSWRLQSFNNLQLPFSNSLVSNQKMNLMILDSLKEKYINTKSMEYLNLFLSIRNEMEFKAGQSC